MGDTRNRIRISKLLLLTLTLLFSQECRVCNSHYTKLDLSKWLEEFQNCDVQVVLVKSEGVVDIGSFSYPISLISDNKAASQSQSHYPYPYWKRTFCVAQVYVDTAYRNNSQGDTLAPFQRLCSKPALGSFASSSPYPYKWTDCISIFVVSEEQSKKQKIALRRNSEMNRRDIQQFLFTFKNKERYDSSILETNFRISKVEYLCLSQCEGAVRWSVPCSRPRCRSEMESMAEVKMEQGRNTVSSLLLTASPFEKLEARRNVRKPLLILPQNKAFSGIARIPAHQYHFLFRTRINFIRMNQAILFENVSRNISSYFQFPNFGLQDYNPTASTEQNQFVSVSTIPMITYGYGSRSSAGGRTSQETIYVTGETYFNFLTCHGFQNSASLTVYLHPFDSRTWIAILTSLICLVVILTLNYISGKSRTWNCMELYS
jgi:hypothetical protein